MDEFRNLCDWTITKTCLDLYMWFKLEDAYYGLYFTKYDMMCRRYSIEEDKVLKKGRPGHEKFWQGFCFIFGLFLLILGPLIFFSSLTKNLRVANVVTGGTLAIDLQVQTTKFSRKVTLYQTTQGDTEPCEAECAEAFRRNYAIPNDQDPYDVQFLQFPQYSDNLWTVSPALKKQMLGMMVADNLQYVDFIFRYSFARTKTEGGGVSSAEQTTSDQIYAAGDHNKNRIVFRIQDHTDEWHAKQNEKRKTKKQ